MGVETDDVLLDFSEENGLLVFIHLDESDREAVFLIRLRFFQNENDLGVLDRPQIHDFSVVDADRLHLHLLPQLALPQFVMLLLIKHYVQRLVLVVVEKLLNLAELSVILVEDYFFRLEIQLWLQLVQAVVSDEDENVLQSASVDSSNGVGKFDLVLFLGEQVQNDQLVFVQKIGYFLIGGNNDLLALVIRNQQDLLVLLQVVLVDALLLFEENRGVVVFGYQLDALV